MRVRDLIMIDAEDVEHMVAAAKMVDEDNERLKVNQFGDIQNGVAWFEISAENLSDVVLLGSKFQQEKDR